MGWLGAAVGATLLFAPPPPTPVDVRDEAAPQKPPSRYRARWGPRGDPLPMVGDRWRFAWLVAAQAYVPFPMFGMTTFLGAGYPVRHQLAHRRSEHAFGYWLEVAALNPAELNLRHQIACTGVVGKRFALFYQVGAGVSAPSTVFVPMHARPTASGRLGLAIGRRLNYIAHAGVAADLRRADERVRFPATQFMFSFTGIGAF